MPEFVMLKERDFQIHLAVAKAPFQVIDDEGSRAILATFDTLGKAHRAVFEAQQAEIEQIRKILDSALFSEGDSNA